MTKWERQRRIDKAKHKAAEKEKRNDIRAAAKALAKVMPHFNPNHNRLRYEAIQKATDILAGRAIYG